MRIRSSRDFFSGLMFLAVGASFSIGATGYSIGTAARMGPGFFPFWLGLILAGLGAVLMVLAASPRCARDRVERFGWKAITLVLGAVVFFGLALAKLGLLLTLAIAVMISSLAGYEHRWKEAILGAAVLTVLCYALFVWLLRLPLPITPWFLG